MANLKERKTELLEKIRRQKERLEASRSGETAIALGLSLQELEEVERKLKKPAVSN